MADPELFLKGGLTDLRGARFSHAAMIPYIINQIFLMKGGPGPARAPLDPPLLNNDVRVLRQNSILTTHD